MILIVVWDGLRPDMITPERTPYLHHMAGQGVFCSASHSAFPTATRINATTITTGCYPGRHGITDNGRYLPALDAAKALDFANWTHLQGMADHEGRRLVSVPTLGEILRDAGKRMVSAGSGSPGTTYLTNPTAASPVINWAWAWPQETHDAIQKRTGFLPQDSAYATRNEFALEALIEYLVPTHRPEVAVLWITEPDHAQHGHAPGSPEAIATLATLDRQLETLVDTLERCGGPHTYLLASDHGFSTIALRVDVNARLVAAGLKPTPEDTSILYDCDSFYLNGAGADRYDDLLRFLAGEPWIGALLVRDDRFEPRFAAYPNAMPQSAVFGNHERSAELMFAYRWSPAENQYGVPGCSASYSTIAATHGSASPYDVNSSLVAWGAGIKRGVVSDLPCGNVDLAPTVLHLLGLPPAPSMQGRVLDELLLGGPDPEGLRHTSSTREATYQSDDGPHRQTAHYSHVRDHRYLDQITWED